MIRLLLFAALALPACALGAGSEPAEAPPTARVSLKPAAPVSGRLAVVELFTSEGCSSCPPADALLERLAERPDVLALSFHVDYWDGLGWRDPYSSTAATARQRAYAGALDGRVYTPEMVVGGTAGFVGSRSGEAQQRIATEAARSSETTVTLAAHASGRTVTLDYAVADAPEPLAVHLLLVQRSAESSVARGENGGRTLRHANVVRVFETRPDASGQATLTLPEGLSARDVMAVALVQQGRVGAIAAAAKADLR